ncbi:hypothetical protein ACFYWD_20635 [Streptomyces sp. NPDC003781]|uniref:hypothetical protein n=1 Tax=Streptomyces sp. NPDC003781 TaxID=3364686 RepID=UPI0036BA1309
MDERLAAALAAIQRVEEVLDAHADTKWARSPETLEIQAAIAGIDTMADAWDPTFSSEATAGTYVLSTRRPGTVSGPS